MCGVNYFRRDNSDSISHFDAKGNKSLRDIFSSFSGQEK